MRRRISAGEISTFGPLLWLSRTKCSRCSNTFCMTRYAASLPPAPPDAARTARIATLEKMRQGCCMICIGVYLLNSSVFDVFMLLGFGLIGYFMLVLFLTVLGWTTMKKRHGRRSL